MEEERKEILASVDGDYYGAHHLRLKITSEQVQAIGDSLKSLMIRYKQK